jgi:RHS repeat-associated protein
MPIDLTRYYHTGDPNARAFGLGTNEPYDIFFTSQDNYLQADLILADGADIHYVRTSPGGDFTNAVYTHTATPTIFYGSILKYDKVNSVGGWDLILKDGTDFRFADTGPLQWIKDRVGNTLQFIRQGSNNKGVLSQIQAPNGRWIKFTYDGGNQHIVKAQDNIGRTVNYAYDANARLTAVADANAASCVTANPSTWTTACPVTKYTYDPNSLMLSIQDPRGIIYLTTTYDSNGRLILERLADNSTFQFAYTTDPNTGNVTQTNFTDQRGNVEQLSFNANGYVTTDVLAQGKPEQQTYTYQLDPVSNAVTSVTDQLSRQATFVYDSFLNVTSATWMANTSGAATTNFTYDPTFNEITSVTDPLNHTWQYSYDSLGNLLSVTDPLSHTPVTFTYNLDGTVATAQDTFSNTTHYNYQNGDMVSVVTPLSEQTTFKVDAAGRTQQAINPLGQTTSYVYDNLNQVTQVTNALGGITSFTYDANGNLLTVQDPHQQGTSANTSYVYDNMDRVITRTDALLRQESYQYDLAGNLIQFNDRRGKITTYNYDGLDRTTFVGFGTVFGNPNTYESTINYTYDGGDRVTQATDSAGPGVTRTYNDVTRTYAETSSQGSTTYGTVTSVLDAAGRRSSMTVAGQTGVSYTYDNANRLTQISQGTSNAGIAYDNANRRTSLTLSNGVTVAYCYDNDSHVTGLRYNNGSAAACPNGSVNLGNLTYAYDAAGRRTQMGGSFARTGLSQPVVSGLYDSANQLLQWNGQLFSYDLNGNMTSDSVNTFAWDARNQLSQFNTTTFQYDAAGRRTKNAAGTNLLYDGADSVQELSGTTPIANRITGGVDEFFSRTDSSGSTTPLTDAVGTTIALVNSSGSIITSYTYDPFGSTTASGTASTNSFQYTGRENDGNGLYYYRARYYNPLVGRFISEDPLKFGGDDVNFYAYDEDDPIDFVDPFGLRLRPKPGRGQQGQTDLADYLTALEYLKRDPGMAGLIKKAEDSSTDFFVTFNHVDDDRYCPNQQYCPDRPREVHTIHWDPRSGWVCTNGRKQSPALGFGHELAHAVGDGKKMRRLLNIADPNFGNKEERRVETTYEIPAAKTLGEGIRWNHDGQPIQVPTTTSH